MLLRPDLLATLEVEQEADETAALFNAAKFGIGPHDLVALAKAFMMAVHEGTAAGSSHSPDWLAADFKFVSARLSRADDRLEFDREVFVEMSSLDATIAFPDLKSNYHAWRVCPFEPGRVYFNAKFTGTNSGPAFGRPPTGRRLEMPVQSCSLLFNARGEVTRFAAGSMLDPQHEHGGGLYGMFNAIGCGYEFVKPLLNSRRRQLQQRAREGGASIPIVRVSSSPTADEVASSSAAAPSVPSALRLAHEQGHGQHGAAQDEEPAVLELEVGPAKASTASLRTPRQLDQIPFSEPRLDIFQICAEAAQKLRTPPQQMDAPKLEPKPDLVQMWSDKLTMIAAVGSAAAGMGKDAGLAFKDRLLMLSSLAASPLAALAFRGDALALFKTKPRPTYAAKESAQPEDSSSPDSVIPVHGDSEPIPSFHMPASIFRTASKVGLHWLGQGQDDE